MNKDSQEGHVRLIQIETLYKNSPLVLIASVFSSSILVAIYWDMHSHIALLIWLSLLLGLSAFRSFQTWRFTRSEIVTSNMEYWQQRFVFPVLLSGVLWGIAGFAFYIPNSGSYQAFGLIVPLAIGAGSMVFLSVVRWIFYSFFLFLTLPLLLRIIVVGDFLHFVMASLLLMYIFMFMIFGYNMNKIFTDSLRLRFKNLELLDKLTQEKEVAERANIAKSKFLAATSHDLRQPLHALTLLSSALRERIKYPEVRHIVDKIMMAVSALENLFNALLDISKLDSGVLRPTLSDFELGELFSKMENDYRPEADRKGIEFKIKECQDVVLYSDMILLERVIRNFISNAIRYTDTGEVVLFCTPENDKVRITVQDTGIGINHESLQSIFDEYVQIGNTERDREKGLGLGLAIVAKISQLLSHPVFVDSEPGKGSSFSIEVPLGRRENISREEPASTLLPVQELTGLRVIIIDDEKSNLDALEALLSGWRCEILAADSQKKACSLIKKTGFDPDCILSDYRLRNNKTGLEAIRAITEQIGHVVPAILITGDVAIKKLHDEGAGDYHLMHKPVQPARLRALLKHFQQQKNKEEH